MPAKAPMETPTVCPAVREEGSELCVEVAVDDVVEVEREVVVEGVTDVDVESDVAISCDHVWDE